MSVTATITPTPSMRPMPRRSKYAAKKVEIDGTVFDSHMEGAYYRELCLRRDAGEITAMIVHPEFELQPAFTKNGKRFRPIKYVADFAVVYRDGSKAVIDVKGDATPVFRLKAKMYSYLYSEPLVCVTQTRKGGWREWTP